MPMRYKINVMDALNARGYTGYRLRRDKIIHSMNIQRLRDGDMVSWSVFEKVCELLDCQPGDIIEYVREEEKR